MPIQQNDFVEIDFVGRLKDDGAVFDVTSVERAKEYHLFSEGAHYGPRVICVGQRQIVKGVDDALLGKEPGKKYTIDVNMMDGFGAKDAKLIKVVSAQVLKKQNINPFPGLRLNASGMLATVKSVSGGRVMLDFNHPLAGKDLVYEVEIHKIILEDAKKVEALLESLVHMHHEQASVTCEQKQCAIKLKEDLPQPMKDAFLAKAKELVPGVELRFA